MKKLCLILLLLAFAVPASAVTLSGLYSAQLPVHSEVAWRRLKIMPKALQQVLVKVSGNIGIAQVPAIKNALPSAQNYVLQYAYEKKEVDQKKQLMLHVDFDPKAIRAILSDAGQVVWGRNRPLTLLWIAIDNGQTSKIIGSGSDSLVAQSIANDTSMRGIPLLLPLMDLADMQKVSAQDIIQGQWNTIEQASQRYLPDAVLLVSVDSTQPNNISSSWSLSLQGKTMQWQEAGATVGGVLNEGFNDLASTLANVYGVANASSAQTIQMQVTGVNDIGALANVVHYLKSLTGVGAVDVATVLPDQVTFNLTLSGDLNSFVQQIKLGNDLIPAQQSEGIVGKPQGLIYRYQR